MTVTLLDTEIIIALRTALMHADRVAIVRNDSEYDFIVEHQVNGIMRVFKVDRHYEKNIQEAYSNPLKTDFTK